MGVHYYSEHVEQALKQYFGYDSFLPGQREIIEQVLSGRDAFVLMPTGAGKSLVYQFSSLLLPGVTVVISPLIALMQDQVERLRTNGIAATFINSSLSTLERSQREKAALNGQLKLLYVAPERLLTGNFLYMLDQIEERVGLSLLAVDEVHCVSEWGHDFRPEYRQLGQLRDRYLRTPMVGLTATATERVRADILDQLRLRNPYIHIASFNRPNLSYEVRQKNSASYRELVQILHEYRNASVLVYCQTRKGVDELTALLRRDGINALPYHAGMTSEERTENQSRFIRDDVPVLVATIAFGMGIAKPDVRAVIHFDLPRSLEGYYQEAGRAGRDGLPAKCILFFNYGDRMKVGYIIGQKSSEMEQYVAHQQLQQVIAYCDSSTCRRRILLEYFGETFHQENCGNCDNCLQPMVIEDRTIDAQKFLSCIGRTQQRFGMNYIIDILRGANTQRIRNNGHDQLSTYGIGKDRSAEEWQHLGRTLLHQGLLTSEMTDGYSILKLNTLSREVLRKQRGVEVAVPVKPVQAPQREEKPTSTFPPLDPESEALFQHLRAFRKQFADEQGVPPYIIFSDATLRTLAQQRPQSQSHFAQIPGIGSRKLEAYFVPFTNAIRDYCETHNLVMGLEPPKKEKEQKEQKEAPVPQVSISPPTKYVTLDMYNAGLSIEDIARERNLKPGTIINHLTELIEAGETLDIERLIPLDRHKIILDALQQVGDELLKPVKEFLGEEYSYDEIRLVRAVMRQSR